MSFPAQKDLEYFISSSFCFWDTVTSACGIPNTSLKTCNSSFWAAENNIRQWYLEQFMLLLPASGQWSSCPALVLGLLVTVSLSTTASYSSCVAQSMCKLHQNQTELLVARTTKRRDPNVLSWAVAVLAWALGRLLEVIPVQIKRKI